MTIAAPSARAAGAATMPKRLNGYAAVFNVETVICGLFREKILPGAFTDSIATDDVVAQFNHDPNYVLGRTGNKTCRLAEDSTGLRYEIDLNEQDPDAQRVGAKVARGDVNGSSFMFSCDNDQDEEWVRDDPAKLPLRIVKRATLYDVAPVTSPAYPTTTVSANSKRRAAATKSRSRSSRWSCSCSRSRTARRRRRALAPTPRRAMTRTWRCRTISSRSRSTCSRRSWASDNPAERSRCASCRRARG